MSKIFVIFIFVALNWPSSLYADLKSEYFWDEYGNSKVDFEKLTKEQKAFVLEKYRPELEYCLANIGKSFAEINVEKVGQTMGYDKDVGSITNGLIGYKYAAYQSLQKSAEYFYKDYLQYHKCEQNSLKTGVWFKEDCWPGAIGEGPVLGHVINTLEMNNDFKGVLPYYQIYLDDWVSRMEGKTYKEKYATLKRKAKWDSEIGRLYNDLMERWGKAKKLAKTVTPTPLDPAVQNHEWFYSDKRGEVLKALDYYYQNKVQFMLEKALAHKDKAVQAKASEYLKKLEPEPAK